MKVITCLSLLALLLVACSDDDNPTGSATSEPVAVFIESDSYSMQDTISTTIVNHSGREVHVPACCGNIEVLVERLDTSGSWLPYTYPTSCPAICLYGAELAPGSRTACVPYFNPVQTGGYRFVLHPYFLVDSLWVLDTIYSRTFEIR